MVVRLIIISFFASLSALGQDLQVLKAVTKDSIAIKWLPNDFAQLQLISKGATVRRIESTAAGNYSSLDFSSGKSWTIGPLKNRFDQLKSSDTQQEKWKALLEPLLLGANEEQQNFAFGTVLIENVSTTGFQFVLGNIVVDKDFKRSARYVYKIEVEGTTPAYVAVDAKTISTYSELKATVELDQKTTVVAKWNYTDVIKETFAFKIEHSVGKKSEGQFVSDAPFLPFKSEFESRANAEFRQEDVARGQTHFYRITGLNAFGEPALYSEWLEIYVPDKIDAYVQIDSVVPQDKNRIIHTRIFTGQRSKPNYEIEVWRASQRDGEYIMVAQSKVSDSLGTFVIAGTRESGDHFYYQARLRNLDDTVFSVPFYHFTLDQEPPSSPVNLTAKVDSTGIVRIGWSAPEDDDLLGYRIFRGNTKKEEFVELSRHLELQTQFTDTLALDNLTSEVYYYVLSVDKNYNQSLHSDTVIAMKPDTIPPVPCVLKNVEVSEGGLFISWVNSNSSDAVKTQLLRDGNLLVGVQGDAYLDTSAVAGQGYTYVLQTIDRSGNQALSNSAYRLYEPGFRKALKATAKVDTKKHGVVLQWSPPKEQVYAIEIYRSKDDAPFTHFKTLHEDGITEFFDNSVRIGAVYTYSIKYITLEGIHSIPVTVRAEY